VAPPFTVLFLVLPPYPLSVPPALAACGRAYRVFTGVDASNCQSKRQRTQVASGRGRRLQGERRTSAKGG
jgi:hypothetical protein